MSLFRSVAIVVIFLVPIGTITDDLVRLTLSGKAMACCAATEGSCASLRAPDECCQTQQQAGISGFTSIAPLSRSADMPAVDVPAAVVPIFQTITTVVEPGGSAFKRPHDPPHLHPVHLLI